MNKQINNLKNALQSQFIFQGTTFDPSIDCRNDLVNLYGYTREQVTAMSDDELFFIMDQIEAMEEGYDTFHDDTLLPHHVKHYRCNDCEGELIVIDVDCETRGDCEIYTCKCKKCNHEQKFNYAEEWYEDFE